MGGGGGEFGDELFPTFDAESKSAKAQILYTVGWGCIGGG